MRRSDMLTAIIALGLPGCLDRAAKEELEEEQKDKAAWKAGQDAIAAPYREARRQRFLLRADKHAGAK